MPTVRITQALSQEYDTLFAGCTIRSGKEGAVERIVDQLTENRSRYEAASAASGVPWHFIAAVHNMETGQRFSRHLHNGDPLTARTTHVPKGYPKTGEPPFSWENSAADALALKRLGRDTDWSLAGTLYQLERYNGFGYRQYHPQILSPYLWSFSNHYTSGKYVADGTWSDTAKSAQCGAAVLLRRLAERGEIAFANQPLPPAPEEAAKPLIATYVRRKPTNADALRHAVELQEWLSTYPGIFLKPDGIAGRNTSDAYRAVTGHYLPGDPRSA